MDLDARRLQYDVQVRSVYSMKPLLLRKWSGDDAKRKEVEEFISLSEELVACSYDAERCAFEATRQDESPRGKGAAVEYRNICERCAARIKEMTPRVAALKEKLGA